ncbi:MAG: hypothetical protein J6V15_02685 [Clostridia bacterium]|nr:hypothetical protein [Clostridia bacterium]
MFNRYINPDAFGEIPRSEKPPEPQLYEDVSSQTCGTDTQKSGGTGKGLFGSGIKLPEFDADTVLMLVLVYFLISDELSPSSKDDGDDEQGKNKISDTLLIIGALLLLGF